MLYRVKKTCSNAQMQANSATFFPPWFGLLRHTPGKPRINKIESRLNCTQRAVTPSCCLSPGNNVLYKATPFKQTTAYLLHTQHHESYQMQLSASSCVSLFFQPALGNLRSPKVTMGGRLNFTTRSNPDIAPLCVRRNLWRYVEGGDKSKCCITVNFSS